MSQLPLRFPLEALFKPARGLRFERVYPHRDGDAARQRDQVVNIADRAWLMIVLPL